MKYEKIYEGKTHLSPVSLSEELKKIPSPISTTDVKIIPVYNVQPNGGSELVGFKFVAYREVPDDF
jgi:hypothetical protein